MRTLFRLLRAGFHGVLLFVLPWGTGALLGSVLDITQVAATATEFATTFAFVALPLCFLQLAAVGVKIRRELRINAREGVRGFAAFVAALERHLRVLTERGVGMAIASLVMVGLALAEKFAELGVLAITGLGALYLASTIASLASAFSVRGFDDRLTRRRGSIDRELAPSVVDAGDSVEERFRLARVPVPPGFRLHIEEALPERLGGHTRFALDRSVSRRELTVSAALPKTPRGVYHLGPADIWYEDVLGLTRVFVASRAKATLRSLPPLRPILLGPKPRSQERAEGSATVQALLPSDEYFRTRPYVPGDDTRRVHWKQSINQGKLILRVPEAVPITPTRVRLVLDTFLPPTHVMPDGRPTAALEDVLDLLVETWTSLAKALLMRGERVSLIAALRQDSASPVLVRELSCKRGESRRWRSLGAEASWQSEMSLDRVLPGLGPSDDMMQSARIRSHATTRTVILSCGLGGLAHLPTGTRVIVADGASVITPAPRSERSPLERLLRYAYPAGADDNRIDWARVFQRPAPIPRLMQDVLRRSMTSLVAFAASTGGAPLLARRRGHAISLEAP